MKPQVLNQRYRLDSEIGRGGMGVVYEAHDLLLDRPVAVKLLSGAMLGTEGRERLLREARSAARLAHPNIVAVYDAGDADGEPYIVMEFVAGGSLRTVAPAGLDQVLDLGLQLCDALEHAHLQGIVHRDIKPENILLAEGGQVVKLADFGLAVARGGARLTSEGALVGTADYLSPEQALGLPVDPRADLYALGCVLYELVAGRRAFPGESLLEIVSQHLHAPVVPPRAHRPDLPAAIEAAILRLMEKDPGRRYASAAATREALLAARAGLPGTSGAPGTPAAATEEAPTSIRLLHQLARGRLVGRAGELQQLREHWARAQAGTGHLVLLSGEPGVGKTRLAREVAVHAQMAGATVLSGGCYEYEATTPYLPFVEALRSWAHGLPDADLHRSFGQGGAELARLVPEISMRLPPAAPATTLPPHEERLRLFEQFGMLFQELSAGAGLLLFLDDLHWADEGTLHLLHHLMRRVGTQRVLVIGGYREVELDRAHPLAAALVEWNRERLSTRIALGRLDREGTARLLASMFEQESTSPEFADAVFRETEGNPFFIEEVVKSLIEQGQIYRDASEWQRSDVGELSIPQSVKEAIGRRLNRLSETCAEALHTAAVLGKQFEFRELGACVSLGEDALLDALDEASSLQLVRPGAGDSYVFTHDKIREVLYEELSPIRRRRAHVRIGEALERLQAGGTPVHAAELAHHFVQAGQLEKALEYSAQAGQKAESVFVLPEAQRHYQQAIECAESLKAEDRLGALYERLAFVRRHQGVHAEAAALFEKAIAHSPDPEARARMKVHLGAVLAQGSQNRGMAILEESIRELDPARHAGLLGMALTSLARFHHYRSELRMGEAAALRAVPLVDLDGEPQIITMTYTTLAGLYQHMGRIPDSIAWARKCVRAGEAHKFPLAESVGYEMLSEGLMGQGRWREAMEAAARNRAIATRVGALDRVAWSLFADQSSLFVGGDLKACIEAGRAGLDGARRVGEDRLALFIYAALAGACLLRLELGEADSYLDLLKAGTRELNQQTLDSITARSLAMGEISRGDWGAAADLLTAQWERVKDSENHSFRLFVGPYHLRSLVRAGRLDAARDLLGVYLDAARVGESPIFEGVVLTSAAELAAAAGDDARARAQFDRAVELLEGVEARLELGWTAQARGRFHARAGRSAEGRADLGRALQLFTACGALLELRSADTVF